MNGFNKNKHFYMMLDTETANGLDDPLFYDLGVIVMDRQGVIYEQKSFVNADIFVDEAELMKSAYYAKKLPQYHEDLMAGRRILTDTKSIRFWVKDMCEKYNVKAVIAHNMRFDYRSCTKTQRWVTNSQYRFFFPRGVEFWDTMRMAESTICQQKRYQKFCEDNNYICRNGQVRKTAEILYRYIMKDNEFAEAHTGLEDVQIERIIFLKCLAQHKKMRRECFGRG